MLPTITTKNLVQGLSRRTGVSLSLSLHQVWTLSTVSHRHKSAAAAAANIAQGGTAANYADGKMAAGAKGLKPLSAMPGPKLPAVLSLLIIRSMWNDQIHSLLEARSMKYGPIWAENYPGMGKFVMVGTAQGTRDFCKTLGNNPVRSNVPVWTDYIAENNWEVGILQAKGSSWIRQRKSVSKLLNRPKEAVRFLPALKQIVDDFLVRIENIRDSKGFVDNVDKEFIHFSVELSGEVLTNRRFGFLENTPPKDYLEATHSFLVTGELMWFKTFLAKIIMRTKYKQFTRAIGTMYNYASNFLDEAKKSPERFGKDTFLGSVISGDMSEEEKIMLLADFLVVSAESTSISLHSVFFELAKRPDAQEKIYQEISQNLPEGSELAVDSFENLQYTKGFIKEILRLFPVAFMIPRIIARDGQIDGYFIPAGTNVAILPYLVGRSAESYNDPMAIKPERWSRDESDGRKIDPFAWMAFGFGDRNCLGKRVALMELYLIVSEIVRKYKLRTPIKEMAYTSGMLLKPTTALRLQFIHREQSVSADGPKFSNTISVLG